MIKGNLKTSVSDFDKILDFYDKIKSFDYGFVSNGKRYTGKILDEEKTFDNYKSMSPLFVEKNEICVCWDAVRYEAYWFSKNVPNIRYKCYYCEYEPRIGNSHTWLVFTYNNEEYVFEQSWRKHQGVKKLSKLNKNDMLTYITDIPKGQHRPSELKEAKYILIEYDPLKERLGLSTNEFMNYKWTHGKMIETNCEDKNDIESVFQFYDADSNTRSKFSRLIK